MQKLTPLSADADLFLLSERLVLLKDRYRAPVYAHDVEELKDEPPLLFDMNESFSANLARLQSEAANYTSNEATLVGLFEKGEKDFHLYDLYHMVNADGLLDLQEEDICTLRGMMLASFEEPELDLNMSE